MTGTETVFNIPCREGSLDVVVRGDSSFADADVNQDSPLLVSPPKVFIHCTCGALHSPTAEGDLSERLSAIIPTAGVIDDNAMSSGLLKRAPVANDYSFHPNVPPRTTSSPIKSNGTSKKAHPNGSAPELHYHEHFHYVDDDDYEGYTSDLNERVVSAAAGNERKKNKSLSKTLNGVKNGSSTDNNGVKVTFVSS